MIKQLLQDGIISKEDAILEGSITRPSNICVADVSSVQYVQGVYESITINQTHIKRLASGLSQHTNLNQESLFDIASNMIIAHEYVHVLEHVATLQNLKERFPINEILSNRYISGTI